MMNYLINFKHKDLGQHLKAGTVRIVKFSLHSVQACNLAQPGLNPCIDPLTQTDVSIRTENITISAFHFYPAVAV